MLVFRKYIVYVMGLTQVIEAHRMMMPDETTASTLPLQREKKVVDHIALDFAGHVETHILGPD